MEDDGFVMRWLTFLGAFCWVGCSSRPMDREFLPDIPVRKARVELPIEPEQPERKAFAGKVTFRGLEAAQLASIRVIPETGKSLFQPNNQTYDQVDGFWWSGEKEAWFKIPDLSEAWVGRKPEGFDRDVSRGDLKIHARTGSLLGVLGALRVKQTRPAWVLDAGATRSPVARPEGF